MKNIINTTVTVVNPDNSTTEVPVLIPFPETIAEAKAAHYEEPGLMALAAAAATQRYSRLLTGKRTKPMTREELETRLEEISAQIRRGFTRRPPKPREPFARVVADMDTGKMDTREVAGLMRHAALELQRRGVSAEQLAAYGQAMEANAEKS